MGNSQIKRTFLLLETQNRGTSVFAPLCKSKNCILYLEVMQLNVGFIGAGKVGGALGLYLTQHGVTISGYYSKTGTSAQEAARITGSQSLPSMQEVANLSSVLFVAVPDHAIEEVDASIAMGMEAQRIHRDLSVFHVSGAHSSDALKGIRAAGAPVGSMHPLQSFGEPMNSAEKLNSTWFTLEGTEKAVELAKTILHKTGGKYSLIQAQDKPLYHAGACVVSNFLITLLESGIRCFEKAGMERNDILKAIDPLIASTLSNAREQGTVDALTGPIVRGDIQTVRIHLEAIRALLPTELDLYQSMARRTVQMLEDRCWTKQQAERFQLLLGETIHVN